MILTEFITVQDFVKRQGCTRLWLCPDIARWTRIDPHPVLKGIDCSVSTIPEIIKPRQVLKWFKEAGVDCIIWKSEKSDSEIKVDESVESGEVDEISEPEEVDKTLELTEENL